MSSHPTGAQVKRGLAWIGVASSLVSVLDFLALLIILNRWVSKDDYGIATMCTWVFPILDQATDLGLSAAVIQRDDHSDTKLATVFWLSLGIGSSVFVLFVIGAPIAATLISHPIVAWMMVVYASKLVIQNAYFIPVALMKRELRFKEISVIRIVANLAEFAGKLGFAAAGFGIWCFVLGPLARVVVTSIGVQLRHPWRPRWLFDLRDAKDYISFGLKSSGSAILFAFYTNIDYPIVGAFFGEGALGLYRIAYEVVLEPVRIISAVVVDIAFPVFAKLRHDPPALIAQLVSFTRLNLIAVLSYAALMLIAAEDVIGLFFPEYRGAELAVRILCIVAVLRAISFVVPPLLDGVGRPERTFTYMLIAAVVLPSSYVIGALVLGPSLGFEAVAVAWAVGYPIAFAVLIYLALATLGWTVKAYLRAVVGVTACTVAGGVAALGVHHMLGSLAPSLRLGITAAVVVVVTGALLTTQGYRMRPRR